MIRIFINLDGRSSRGGKCGLSNMPIFPQPLCLSKQHKHGKEPEAHASGAWLLREDSHKQSVSRFDTSTFTTWRGFKMKHDSLRGDVARVQTQVNSRFDTIATATHDLWLLLSLLLPSTVVAGLVHNGELKDKGNQTYPAYIFLRLEQLQFSL